MLREFLVGMVALAPAIDPAPARTFPQVAGPAPVSAQTLVTAFAACEGRALAEIEVASSDTGSEHFENGLPEQVTLQPERDVPLLVDVRAADGRPAADVLLRVTSVYGIPAGLARPALSPRIGEARTDASGRATFPHAQRWSIWPEDALFVVELDFPLLRDVEVEFAPHALPKQPLELALPPTGSVILAVEDRPGSSVRLSEAVPWEERESSRDGRRREMAWVPVRDGHARFPFVGLGLDLAYEVRWDGQTQPMEGRARGPAVVGEVVELPALDTARDPRLVGRLLDADLQPMAAVRIQGLSALHTQSPVGFSSSWHGFEFATDAAGRFSLDLTEGWSEGQYRQLSFAPWYEWSQERRDPESEPEVLVDLSRDLAAGPCELGDVVLVAANSKRRWSHFDDDALEVEWARWRAQRRVNGIHDRECESVLAEMGRRGGARWVEFLTRAHAELEAKADQREYGAEEELALPAFRALRRAQGQPDPLKLEIEGAPRIECSFPELPVLRWTIVNRDPEETFLLQKGGSYRSGRFARLRFEMRREDGTEVTPLPSPGFLGGGMSTRGLLAPGERWGGGVEMARYVAPPAPGDYCVRLQYHDHHDFDGIGGVAGRMVIESDEFVLHVKPGRVRLTRAEHRELARDVRAIDAKRPVLLTSATWRADMRFEGPADTPAERLFRAGWKSLPSLLEALEDTALDEAHVDWVMGLCFDITGLNPPGGLGVNVLRDHRWVGRWPTSDGPEVERFGEWNAGKGGVTPEARKAYRARWSAVREAVVVEFSD